MAGLNLRGDTSGSVEIVSPAVAGDNTITLPNDNGSANQFFKNSTTAGILTTSSMIEDASGNVGLGTTSPSEKLHIHEGDVVIGQVSGNNTDIKNYIKFGRADNPKAAIGFVNNGGSGRGDILFINSNAGNSSPFENSEEVMRVTRQGRVGVGTSAPTEELHVVGDARVTGNINLPGQERFLSYKNGDQTANDTDDITVQFPAATYDTAGGFDNSNNRYVVQNSGFFHLYAQILITTSTSNKLREAAISIERSTDSGSNWTVLTSSADRVNSNYDSDSITFHCTIMSELNAGDYLRVGAFCNTADAATYTVAHNVNDVMGGNFTLAGSAQYDGRVSYFMGVRIA